MLNVREWTGPNPLKLILSSTGSFNKRSAVIGTGSDLVVFTHNSDKDIPGTVKVILKNNVPSAFQISGYLHSSGIQSLLIEGGAEIINHFVSTGLWDEARIFKGEDYFQGGVKAPQINGTLFSKTIFSGSSLEIFLKNGS
jgi:diaminohydroxyphosphoribosylaminopyrimidine deaminase/5-amino-6-(5-phosphoribosylamino)uracil reductase